MAGPFAAFLRRTPVAHIYWSLGAAAPAPRFALAASNPRKNQSSCPAEDVGTPLPGAAKGAWDLALAHPPLTLGAASAARPAPDSDARPSWPTSTVRLSTVLAAILRQRLPRALARLLLRRWRARARAAAKAAGREGPAIAAADALPWRRVLAALRCALQAAGLRGSHTDLNGAHHYGAHSGVAPARASPWQLLDAGAAACGDCACMRHRPAPLRRLAPCMHPKPHGPARSPPGLRLHAHTPRCRFWHRLAATRAAERAGRRAPAFGPDRDPSWEAWQRRRQARRALGDGALQRRQARPAPSHKASDRVRHEPLLLAATQQQSTGGAIHEGLHAATA